MFLTPQKQLGNQWVKGSWMFPELRAPATQLQCRPCHLPINFDLALLNPKASPCSGKWTCKPAITSQSIQRKGELWSNPTESSHLPPSNLIVHTSMILDVSLPVMCVCVSVCVCAAPPSYVLNCQTLQNDTTCRNMPYPSSIKGKEVILFIPFRAFPVLRWMPCKPKSVCFQTPWAQRPFGPPVPTCRRSQTRTLGSDTWRKTATLYILRWAKSLNKPALALNHHELVHKRGRAPGAVAVGGLARLWRNSSQFHSQQIPTCRIWY